MMQLVICTTPAVGWPEAVVMCVLAVSFAFCVREFFKEN